MDDKLLVSRVLAGEDGALRILIGKYERLVGHMVARVIYNDEDREELCQDVFVKVYEKLSTFQFESKLSTWIATIAYRMAVNFAKKRKLDQVELDNIQVESPEDSNSYEKEDLSQYVSELIEKLPVNYKLVLNLFYLEEFSYPEIVEITGMPEGTVKNYLHRAKSKLKVIIEEQTLKEEALL